MKKFYKEQISKGNLRRFTNLKSGDRILVAGKKEVKIIENINYTENKFTTIDKESYNNIDIRCIL